MERARWLFVAAILIFGGAIGLSVYMSGSGAPEHEGPDEWLGFVYPDPTFLGHHEIVGAFPTLDACLRAVRAETAPDGRHPRGTYECGVNCGDRDGAGTFVCERTVGNER